MCRVSPAAPALTTTCLIMRILTPLGSDGFHEPLPRRTLPMPSWPGDPTQHPRVCNEGTQKHHCSPKHGFAPTVTPPRQLLVSSSRPQLLKVHWSWSLCPCSHIAHAEAKANRAPRACCHASAIPPSKAVFYSVSESMGKGCARHRGEAWEGRNHRDLGLRSQNKRPAVIYLSPWREREKLSPVLTTSCDRARGEVQAQATPPSTASQGAQHPPWMSTGRSCRSPSARKMLMALCSM